jgi:hypothetical protein
MRRCPRLTNDTARNRPFLCAQRRAPHRSDRRDPQNLESVTDDDLKVGLYERLLTKRLEKSVERRRLAISPKQVPMGERSIRHPNQSDDALVRQPCPSWHLLTTPLSAASQRERDES